MQSKKPEVFNEYAMALNSGIDNLLNHASTIAYYMRGGVQYDRVIYSTYRERKVWMDLINSRLKEEYKKVSDSKGKLNAVY